MLIIIVPVLIVLLGIVVGWLLWRTKNESDGLLAALRRFVKPNWQKLAVFALFLFIAYTGNSQAWVFSGKGLGEPPPPLYTLLKPYPMVLPTLWMTLVILLIPLFMLSTLIVAVAGHRADFIHQGPFWLVVIIHLAYFYTLACLIVFVGGRIFKKLNWRKQYW
jgi:uncharacterized membrane protein YbhN (UPF0104 family)